MAYVTGTATSLANLQSALFAGCTANGWTQDGNVLYKGSCQVIIDISGNLLRIEGGTGRTTGAITGGAGYKPAIGAPANASNAVFNFSFPVTYELYVFANPDEVFLIVNTSVVQYQVMAFGMSDVVGLPGNGTWFWATIPPTIAAVTTPVSCYASYGAIGTISNSQAYPILLDQLNASAKHGSIHHNYDGVGWSQAGSGLGSTWGTTGSISWLRFADPLLGRQPSALNEGAVLVPMDVWAGRPTNNISLALRLRNCRALRIDNHDPGQIITYGPDKWKVYPWFRKNSAVRDGVLGTPGSDHTGTMGWAVKYEGP
jgi:hypothetical protein